MIDKIFTPKLVAADVVAATSSRHPKIVADFASGDGALLALAAKRWSRAVIVANDIDKNESARLRRRFPSWRVSSCDFLNEAAVQRSRLSSVAEACDLVLLNPPFSYRGWQSWKVRFRGAQLTCSRAVAFVLRSLEMISPTGQLVAVLPQGCLSNKADEQAWKVIGAIFDVRIVNEYGKRTFAGCFPRTVLVQLSPRHKRPQMGPIRLPVLARVPERLGTSVTIVRGWIPMYTVANRHSGDPLSLVHTKDLNGERLRGCSGTVSSQRSVYGPGVLMPRVGQPGLANVTILPAGTEVALSDCVIALLTATESQATALNRILVESWPTIEVAFGGTCARYITLAKLGSALRKCGVCTLEFRTPTDVSPPVLRAKTA